MLIGCGFGATSLFLQIIHQIILEPTPTLLSPIFITLLLLATGLAVAVVLLFRKQGAEKTKNATFEGRLAEVLVDDELPGLEYLKTLCLGIPFVEVVRTFNRSEKLLAEKDSLSFDLALMDIENQIRIQLLDKALTLPLGSTYRRPFCGR